MHFTIGMYCTIMRLNSGIEPANPGFTIVQVPGSHIYRKLKKCECYRCHVNEHNLPYSDMCFNID